MRILTRYLLRAHLGPFLFSLSVLTSLLLINTVARRFEELAGKGLSASVILEVFVLSVPYTLALTFPMSVLVAVLYVFSQLTADNEVTTLKASGVSMVRLIAPLIAVAVLVAGGMVWFNDRVLPETNHRLKNLLVDIGRKSPTLQLKEQVINEIQTSTGQRAKYFLQAAEVEPATNRLRDVVVYDLGTRGRERTIYADSGRMAFNRERTDLFLALHDGWIHERTDEEPNRFFRLFYDRQVIRIDGVGNALERSMDNAYRGDREMSVAMLREEVAERRAQRAEVREEALGTAQEALRGAIAGPGGELTTPTPMGVDHATRRTKAELESMRSRARTLKEGINRHRVELHKKYAIPFACIVFVLIGAPLAMRFPRGGVGMVIAFSLLIFSIYWMGLTGGEQLGDKGIVSPVVGMWSVNVIFLALGVWSMARIGREASTARGGGWDDLLYTLRGVAARRWATLRRLGGR